MATPAFEVFIFEVLAFKVFVFEVFAFKVFVFKVFVLEVLGLRSWGLSFPNTHSLTACLFACLVKVTTNLHHQS